MEPATGGFDRAKERPLAGLRQDGMPLYRCEACGRTLAKEAFDIRADGAPHELCRRCEERQKRAPHGWAANSPKRPEIAVESKRCAECGQTKEARFYWADRKARDGLSKRCIACMKEHRRNMKAGTEQPWPMGNPGRELPEQAQAVLDQAIAERDAAMQEIGHLRQTLNGRDTSDAGLPDGMVVALARIETMCASMAGQMFDPDRQQRPSIVQMWLCRGMRRAADALARAAGELDRRAGGE